MTLPPARPVDIPALFQTAVTLHQQGRLAEAYETYLRVLKEKPAHAGTHNNAGAVLMAMQRTREALAAFDEAARLKPGFAHAHHNRGLALRALKQTDEAVAAYDRAIALDPDYAEAHYNRGIALSALKHPEAALDALEAAYRLQPALPFLAGTRLHIKMQLCIWDNFARELADLEVMLARGEKCVPPFAALSLTASPALQRQAAEINARDKNLHVATARPARRHNPDGKIRVGYFSMDFRNHPVAFLLAELIERHDRAKFEIYGFSFGPDPQDALRLRLEKAFDKFIDVAAQSDAEIAATARAAGIDIAIDLGGYTNDARPGIFAFSPAPVHVNYLGYPGTLGAPFMDYIVGDSVVIPVGNRDYYSEKVVTLPHSYQCTDTTRAIPDRIFTRGELELPPTGFVFCCFNNAHKITPDVFDVWMRILRRVAGSVLWLLEDNATAAEHLRREAERRGVAAARLIFAKRAASLDHLARHRAADLFLDTAPYNAHTTASDALWAGLPLLTCIGDAFAGRVAASLLRAVDLVDLVTASLADYEALAVALAENPDRLKNMRGKLARMRATAPLFDTAGLARNLESAFTAMMARQSAGRPPEHIAIAAAAAT